MSRDVFTPKKSSVYAPSQRFRNYSHSMARFGLVRYGVGFVILDIPYLSRLFSLSHVFAAFLVRVWSGSSAPLVQLNIPRRKLQQVFPYKIWLRASTNDRAQAALFLDHLIQYRERARLVRCDAGALLDLDGIERPVLFNDQIDLALGFIFLPVPANFFLSRPR